MKLQQRWDQSEGRLRGIRLLRWFRIYSTHANIHSSRMLQFHLGVKNAAAEFLHDFLSPEEVRLGMYRSERRIPAQFWTLHRVTGVNLPNGRKPEPPKTGIPVASVLKTNPEQKPRETLLYI